MKFIKGVVFGTMLTAGAMMIYAETNKSTKKKWMKQGKMLFKKMGDGC